MSDDTPAKAESVLRKSIHEWRVPLNRDVMATIVLSSKDAFEPSCEDIHALGQYVELFAKQMKPEHQAADPGMTPELRAAINDTKGFEAHLAQYDAAHRDELKETLPPV